MPLVRLRSQHLQRDLNRVYVSSLDSPQCEAPLWHLLMEDCDIEVSTDATNFGWGIHHDGAFHQGRWED